jgi:methylenetetrahydrofolate dehydrogenase (NADP+)/methenyltetrahydrofolate cyclohydrolase/formyltetrahydrofolate synthetase
MVATNLDGTAISKKIRERIAAEIVETQKANPIYRPFLKIIQGMHRQCQPRITLLCVSEADRN